MSAISAEKCGLEGLWLLTLKLYRDDRGFFVERFRSERMRELGVQEEFVQDNHSRSAPGVLRGLHYQMSPAQGKLVSVIRGSIWDVAVDLRKNSPTLGQHFGTELSDENGKALWVPPGFAHGFCVLGNEPADVLYKVTGYYNPASESGVKWDDPDLKVSWPLASPIVSARDNALKSFRETAAL